jgi:hypothetical protein
MMKHSLDWAARGLPVFPLQPRSKIPFAGSRGFKDATRDENIIREWWTQKPDANIGLAMGDKLFVVDLDGPDAVAWFINASGRHGEPDKTLTVKTARGWHLYFWAPCEIPNSAGLLAPHVDVRGVGGYVVGAPSIHPSGYAYKIVKDLPIAEAPRWLTDGTVPDEKPPEVFLRPDLEDASKLRAITGIANLVESAGEGERNRIVYWAACRFAEMVRDGLITRSYADELLVRAGTGAGLPAWEVRSATRSAFSGRARA